MGSQSSSRPPTSAASRDHADELGMVMTADVAKLRRRLRAGRSDGRSDGPGPALQEAISASRQRAAQRFASRPRAALLEELPITTRQADLAAAIASHQVVIVAGETGSGKTTQLPKLMLEMGLGSRGMLGCTQPRRIAARSVAQRVAEELGVSFGEQVGYQVRFTDQTTADTRIKFMTDGILLAETRSDPDFSRYDALIIDEAHERSLNIDFLLGYLHRLLPRRPDLKLVITSATIDTERFSKHFNDAPVIEVSGRGYPVEIRYRPLHGEDEDHRALDLNQGIAAALEELSGIDARGDVLVFLAGERDIREAADYLAKQQLRHTEILPLIGRMSPQEQARVFHPGKLRRVILATNVAETSITVPGIRFVIDSGRARISRYSHRSKMQRLPIESVSQASANQRAGRCGRLGPGTCIRLYSEEDFEGRESFTEPEVLRTSLAAVILQMLDLGLGDIDEFPFLESPAARMISDGYQVLQELGALDSGRQLTEIGRQLAHLPVDVRLGRMLLAGSDEDCLAEILTLAAMLAGQDPRLRPLDAQKAADEAHAQFADDSSDFVAVLNMYATVEQQRRELGGSAFRRWCEGQFLSWLRLREWRDLRRQLADACRSLKLKAGRSATVMDADRYRSIHRALVTALPSLIGQRDEKQWYNGARGRRFLIHPGSGLYGRPPAWIVCGEILETSQVFGRMAARIEPAWLEQAVPHLLTRSYADPHWSARAGRVTAMLQVSLYGLILASNRRVPYADVDAQRARELFVMQALVNDELGAELHFIVENRARIAAVHALEARRRARDLLVDESVRAQYLAEQLPAGLCTRKGLLRWYRKAVEGQPDLLVYPETLLLNEISLEQLDQDTPTQATLGAQRVSIEYAFDPGASDDGASCSIPLAHLNSIDQAWLDHLVPALLPQQLEALLRALPKAKRRQLVPIPATASAVSARIKGSQQALIPALVELLNSDHGVSLSNDDFDRSVLPDHLRPRLLLIDDQGKQVASGRDLQQLQQAHRDAATQAFLDLAGGEHQRADLRRWDFGELPRQVAVAKDAFAYPALVDQGDRVAIELFDTEQAADDHMVEGLMRLIFLNNRTLERAAFRQLSVPDATYLKYASIDTRIALDEDIVYAAMHELLCQCEVWPCNAEEFEALAGQVGKTLLPHCQGLCAAVTACVEAAWPVSRALGGDLEQRFPDAFDDLSAQYQHLMFAGFVRHYSLARLGELPRYFQAMAIRIERLDLDPERDQTRMLTILPYWQQYLALAQHHWGDLQLEALHWDLEELRVSLFAQSLKTAYRISPKRVARRLQDLELSGGESG